MCGSCILVFRYSSAVHASCRIHILLIILGQCCNQECLCWLTFQFKQSRCPYIILSYSSSPFSLYLLTILNRSMGLLNFVKRSKKESLPDPIVVEKDEPEPLSLPDLEAFRSPIADTFMSPTATATVSPDASYSLLDDIWKELTPSQAAVLPTPPVPLVFTSIPAVQPNHPITHDLRSPRVSSPARPPPVSTPISPPVTPLSKVGPQPPFMRTAEADPEPKEARIVRSPSRPVLVKKTPESPKPRQLQHSPSVPLLSSVHPIQLGQPPVVSKALMSRMKERHRQEYRLTAQPTSQDRQISSPSMPNLYRMANEQQVAFMPRHKLPQSKSFGRLNVPNNMVQPPLTMDIYRQPGLQMQPDILPIHPMYPGQPAPFMLADRPMHRPDLFGQSQLQRSKSAYPAMQQEPIVASVRRPLLTFDPSEQLPPPPPPNTTPITGDIYKKTKPEKKGEKKGDAAEPVVADKSDRDTEVKPDTRPALSHVKPLLIHKKTRSMSDHSMKRMPITPPEWVPPVPMPSVSLNDSDIQSKRSALSVMSQDRIICRLSSLPNKLKKELGWMRMRKAHYSVPNLPLYAETEDGKECESVVISEEEEEEVNEQPHHRHPVYQQPMMCSPRQSHPWPPVHYYHQPYPFYSPPVCHKHAPISRTSSSRMLVEEGRKVRSSSGGSRGCKKHQHHHHHHHHHYPNPAYFHSQTSCGSVSHGHGPEPEAEDKVVEVEA
ncbi:hypothetical protein CLU79DRAFT_726779 [Phycomyces nitens]|nr:hypothetical protein CLU79DRAFT_726779 [Phycomyces nitens]